ncbi:hypothetical protein Q0Z83_046450 [Actinoplanes sichuanensis]|uniref:Tetratricopeptide repeat protein n=1 Tax=Actinoplanes sichuanensis TaxID=512349 RepID=A0ABW4AAX4_9ACTN|nr:hypothetical protein [Actinoplanes sichuanensis]BEL06454.1 hypothetical protein Q0Z83_046450 [Actinoplanes sichuanensis]
MDVDPYPDLEPPLSTVRAADQAAERGDYAAAIEMYVSVLAEFPTAAHRAALDEAQNHAVYEAKLGRLDALARSGRLDELTALAETDHQARRRLDRQLHQEGRADELRARAVDGDRTALYLLIRILRDRDEDDAARRVVQELAPDNVSARELAYGPKPGPWPPSMAEN